MTFVNPKKVLIKVRVEGKQGSFERTSTGVVVPNKGRRNKGAGMSLEERREESRIKLRAEAALAISIEPSAVHFFNQVVFLLDIDSSIKRTRILTLAPFIRVNIVKGRTLTYPLKALLSAVSPMEIPRFSESTRPIFWALEQDSEPDKRNPLAVTAGEYLKLAWEAEWRPDDHEGITEQTLQMVLVELSIHCSEIYSRRGVDDAGDEKAKNEAIRYIRSGIIK